MCVGRDGRLSSLDMADALSCGLNAAGINVVDVGLVATPMLYFASKMLDAPGAIMVTGSHNPPDYNGFKAVLYAPFWADDLAWVPGSRGCWRKGDGHRLPLDVMDAYVGRIARTTGVTANSRSFGMR